jgi:hypothetical protein
MRGSELRVALLVALLTLAGCSYGVGGSAPAAPSAGGADAAGGESAATESDGFRRVSLENSSIDLPAERIFADVLALVNEDVDQPKVQVLVGDSAGSDAFAYPYTPYGFVEDLALTEVGPGGGDAAGITDVYGSVYLVAGNASTPMRTKILVHEYVHTVQRRASLLPWDPTEMTGNVPTDEAQTRLALTEGAAVWVTDRYVERHMAANVTPQSARIAEAYAESEVGGRYFLARYHLGYAAVDRRIDDPNELRSLYEGDVPETTEQLIHGDTPAEEPMEPLDLTASDTGAWQHVDPTDEDRLGELFVRVALSRNLSREAAAAAADGWAYDRLAEFQRDGDPAYAWVTRWDDAANATEFEGAFDTYADRRAPGECQTVRIERPGERVVVVYSGPAAFTEAARASLANETVRISVAE